MIVYAAQTHAFPLQNEDGSFQIVIQSDLGDESPIPQFQIRFSLDQAEIINRTLTGLLRELKGGKNA